MKGRFVGHRTSGAALSVGRSSSFIWVNCVTMDVYWFDANTGKRVYLCNAAGWEGLLW